MKRRYIISLALVALLLIIPGCGRDNSDDAPADAKITISPSSNTISVAAGYPLTTYTSSFTIVVKDAKGTPLNDVDVTISYPWASTSTSTGVVQFYDGVPDGGASATVSPMTATTDKNGAYTIWFTSVCNIWSTLFYK